MKFTISGADNSVGTDELVLLSKMYPFVEWGVLVSEEDMASNRYPTYCWIDDLVESALCSGHDVNLSMHLCGRASNEVWYHGDDHLIKRYRCAFKRFQLNGVRVPGCSSLALRDISERNGVNFILQMREADQVEKFESTALQSGGCHIVFDPSAGTGRSFLMHPNPNFSKQVVHGRAGGINPDNLQQCISIAFSEGVRWIDLESGARDENDDFCFDKVIGMLSTMKVRLGV